MKIGIFGESPYETDAMKALLENRHKQVRVVPMIKHLQGGQMLSAKAIKLFKAEMDLVEDYALVIAMHDLDAPPSNHGKKKEIDEWFAKFKKLSYCESILLVHIQEIEALLLADTAVVNKAYKCKLKPQANPEHQSAPKEHLIQKTYNKANKHCYKESDIEKLFKQLEYDNLLKVPYFKRFHAELDSVINPK